MINFYTGLAQYANWTVPNPCTVCHWIILRGFNGTINRFFGSDDRFETKFVVSSTKYQEDFYATGGVPSTTNGAIGTRVHFAAAGTYPGNVKLYINGVLENTDGSPSGMPPTPATVALGGRTGSTDYANGDMEDIRVYNRELSAAEIKDIFCANGRDQNIKGLINRWLPHSKGDGNDIGTDPIYDYSASRQNAAKLSGSVLYRGGFLNTRRRV